MEVIGQYLQIGEPSAVGAARRAAVDVARQAGLEPGDIGRVALVVTEAATNLVKHAGGGELLLSSWPYAAGPTVDVISLDRGPGIRDASAALRDGFSSAGTTGTGLGAISRIATAFDLYTGPGLGTALFARVGAPARPARTRSTVSIGGVAVPFPGEPDCGDAWAMQQNGRRVATLLADGIGHGDGAASAARAAVATFLAHPAASPGATLAAVHAALRPTRGAAVAIAEIDRDQRLVRFAGLGNVAGIIVTDRGTRSMVSHHGTAGHDARRIQEFTYPWFDDALLVLHSDGLTSRWSFDAHPGLIARHPMLIAAVLYRDFRRGRDDATVAIVREAP